MNISAERIAEITAKATEHFGIVPEDEEAEIYNSFYETLSLEEMRVWTEAIRDAYERVKDEQQRNSK